MFYAGLTNRDQTTIITAVVPRFLTGRVHLAPNPSPGSSRGPRGPSGRAWASSQPSLPPLSSGLAFFSYNTVNLRTRVNSPAQGVSATLS